VRVSARTWLVTPLELLPVVLTTTATTVIWFVGASIASPAVGVEFADLNFARQLAWTDDRLEWLHCTLAPASIVSAWPISPV
jgi:hypothetical protein